MAKQAKAIQICGTGSGVGKSVLVTALCRIFLQDGFKVCPFKAQNMALNSYVTKDNGEIGRAQATQAQSAKIEPTVDMNPILMKPSSDRRAQIIVRGKPIKNMSVYEYVKYKKTAKEIVLKSFDRLANEFQLIVIEGAGSPAEINLKSHDIVNMQMAKYAHAPVILVGDIDKGGVFAWIVGTLSLLTKEERKMVKGIIINKFRGDKRLLKPAIDFLEKKTKIKVLGVVPYFSAFGENNIKIPEEDSIPINNERREAGGERREKINIAIIQMPHISNFTDFDALENEPDVNLYYVRAKEELKTPDIIILPGTKNTIEDLSWLKKTGIANKILITGRACPSPTIIGICGGYQMLGRNISDPEGIESTQKQIKGLDLLPVKTSLKPQKMLLQTQAIHLTTNTKVKGYQIHHGRTTNLAKAKPVFKITNNKRLDGTISLDGRIWGTYLHGVFDNHVFRRHILNDARRRIGLTNLVMKKESFNLETEFDKLAALVRKNIDMKLVYKIMNYEL